MEGLKERSFGLAVARDRKADMASRAATADDRRRAVRMFVAPIARRSRPAARRAIGDRGPVDIDHRMNEPPSLSSDASADASTADT